MILDRLHVADGLHLTRLGEIEVGGFAAFDVDWEILRDTRPVEAAHWVPIARSAGVDLGPIPDAVAAIVAEIDGAA